MKLDGWGFAECRGQPTNTEPQALNDYDYVPASWAESRLARPPEPIRRGQAPGRPTVTSSAGRPARLLDLCPGDRVRLPVTLGEPPRLAWSEPVTITDVLLIDTELVQVRWSPEGGQDPFAAHLLLTGAAYHAGALRCLPAMHESGQ